MTIRAMGAGPGPVKSYKVDMPFPWGKDTEVVVPVQQMVDDTWLSLAPHIDELEARLVTDMENEANQYGPVLVKNLMDTVVLPRVQTDMEEAFAEFEMLKNDAMKTVVLVGATLLLGVGFAAWWVKKG